MAGKWHHETLYRGAETLERLAAVPLTLCGAGAIGSHLADNLVRQGCRRLRVIDRDRVEEHNVSTQLYGESDVGAGKVEVLRQRLFRTAGVEVEALRKELDARTAPSLLRGSGLVLDTFDNATARQRVQDQCRALHLACLHVGLYADYGEIIWDESYRVPRDAAGDVCDYPLARNLVLLVVAVTAETILRYIDQGARTNWSVTLKDFAIRALDYGALPRIGDG